MGALNSFANFGNATINSLCDYTRLTINSKIDEYIGDINAIASLGSVNINSYLIRKEKLMINGMHNPLRRKGVVNLYELGRESEIESDPNKHIAAYAVIGICVLTIKWLSRQVSPLWD